MIGGEELDLLMAFSDYCEYYPEVDEEGYDGIHDGIKGLVPNAPEEAKVAYSKWLEFQKECAKKGIKV